jgi:hypothetical protein
MTDKKVICRLDDYLDGKIDESRICGDIDELFIDTSYITNVNSGIGEYKISFDTLYEDKETCEISCAKSAKIMKIC